jgi:hypothetical protein
MRFRRHHYPFRMLHEVPSAALKSSVNLDGGPHTAGATGQGMDAAAAAVAGYQRCR